MHNVKSKGKLIVEISRQRLSTSLVERTRSVLGSWASLFSGSFQITRNSSSRLLVDTLSVIQAMSPADVVSVAVTCSKSSVLLPITGVDRGLVDLFEINLNRTLRVYREALSLTELVNLYCELLDLSASVEAFSTYRSQFGDALVRRIRSRETIPDNFSLHEFLDAFSADLDEEILSAVSAFVLAKIEARINEESLDSTLMDSLLSVDSAYARMKLKPCKEFVQAVKLFITGSS